MPSGLGTKYFLCSSIHLHLENFFLQTKQLVTYQFRIIGQGILHNLKQLILRGGMSRKMDISVCSGCEKSRRAEGVGDGFRGSTYIIALKGMDPPSHLVIILALIPTPRKLYWRPSHSRKTIMSIIMKKYSEPTQSKEKLCDDCGPAKSLIPLCSSHVLIYHFFLSTMAGS